MGSYEDTVRILEVELGQVEQGFRGLAEADWATPTKLRPLDETKPPWTLFELAGQVGRDRVRFFILPRSEVAPVVYDYAYTMVEGKTPAQMPDVLAATFAKTVDEFVASRVVEAVVHGLDLTDALGREPMATPEGVAVTAAILDDLLARKTVAGRPPDLGDDMAWVRAASGRGPEHPDPRLPLIG